MKPFGVFLRYLDRVRVIWSQLVPFGVIWSPVEPFSAYLAIFSHFEPFQAIWTFLDILIHLEPFGVGASSGINNLILEVKSFPKIFDFMGFRTRTSLKGS